MRGGGQCLLVDVRLQPDIQHMQYSQAPQERVFQHFGNSQSLFAAASFSSNNIFNVEMLPALRVLAESFQLMKQSPAFQNWTSTDWLLGLTVMAQHNTAQRKKKRRGRSGSQTSSAHIDRTLMDALLRYVRMCDAVYADSDNAFCNEARLSPGCIVCSSPGGVFSPKYIVVLDHNTREIVVIVRGSATILDFCTDLCLVNETFQGGQGHRGMVRAATWLVKDVQEDLKRLARDFPEYRLVTTGHSLGAGVAALASMLLYPLFPSIRCIAFATPASVTLELARSCHSFVTSVVHGDDCVPRLHEHGLLRLQQQVSQFDWRSALKQLVVEEVDEHAAVVKQKSDRHLQLIYDTMERLKATQTENVSKVTETVCSSAVVKRVSASIDLTKAVWIGDCGENRVKVNGDASMTDSALDRLHVVKRVLQRHQQDGLGGDKWLRALETSVHRLENLIANRTKENASSGLGHQFNSVADRITNVADETTRRVSGSAKDATANVNAYTETWKRDAQAAMKRQMTLEKWAGGAEAQVEEAIRVHAETLMNNEAMQKLLAKFSIKELESDDTNCELKHTPLHAPLFPPGQILYLRSVDGHDHPLNEHTTLEVVDNDMFSSVVLSNNMIVDHLCTTYERALQNVTLANTNYSE